MFHVAFLSSGTDMALTHFHQDRILRWPHMNGFYLGFLFLRAVRDNDSYRTNRGLFLVTLQKMKNPCPCLLFSSFDVIQSTKMVRLFIKTNCTNGRSCVGHTMTEMLTSVTIWCRNMN